MAVYLHRIRELAVKAETTKGTFNTPNATGTESKILLHNAQLAFEIESHDRPVMASDLSKYPALIGKLPVTLTFGIEARRTTATTTENQWGSLFKGCGFVLTNPASNCVYKPSSSHAAHTCLSFYAYVGSSGSASVRFAIKGAMGTVRSVSVVGQASMWEFTFNGVYNGISTVGAVNAVTHETDAVQAFLSSAFTYNTLTAVLSRFTWDIGNEVVQREDSSKSEGIAHFAIVNRNPTFEMDPEFEATGTIDWIGDWTAASERAIAYEYGAAATLAVSIPKAQITRVNEGQRNGLLIAEVTGAMNRSSGNDEITITAD